MSIFHRLLFVPSLMLAYTAYAEPFQAFTGDGFGQWKVVGDAFGQAPTAGGQNGLAGKVKGFVAPTLAASYNKKGKGKGSLTSPKFTLSSPYLAFLIGGSKSSDCGVQLRIDNKVVLEATGNNSTELNEVVWNVSAYAGKSATLHIFDTSEAEDGFILVDEILFSNQPQGNYPKRVKHSLVDTRKLVSNKVIPSIQIPQGSTLKLFADHKKNGVYSPTALTIDEQGEVLVSETHRIKHNWGVDDNRRRRHWILEDLASQTTDDRMAMYKRWYHKHPESIYTTRSEKIRRLVDTNNDGIADKSNIYADDFNDHLDGTAAGIYAFNGTTYFACIPHIWALKDNNGDHKIDASEKHSIQDGFGVRVSFSGHDLNGFVAGPDGRIYCTIGDRGFNIKTKEGRHYKFPGQGAILRFDPDGSNMEVVHTGLRNPKEFTFDQWGNGISVDNNSDQGDKARVVLMVEGADSGWRMGHQILHSFHRTAGLEQRPINRWKQEDMWKPRNNKQPAFFMPPLANLTSGPSGLTYYPGGGAVKSFKDQFLICDYRGGASHSGITAFSIDKDGANMKVTGDSHFNWGVAATDLEYGYDGKIYVADFIGGWSSHNDGRIYTIESSSLTSQAKGKEVKALFAKGFGKLSEKELTPLLDHWDSRVRLRAQFALADAKNGLAIFTSILDNAKSSRMESLHATWGLGMLARKNKSNEATTRLVKAFQSSAYPEVREQAAKCLGESTLPNGNVLIPALTSDNLRLQHLAAVSIGRLKSSKAVQPLIDMIATNDNKDLVVRHAAMMGLMGNITPNDFAKLSSHPSDAVRLMAVVALRRHKSPLLAQFLGDASKVVQKEAILAIHDTEVTEAQPALAQYLDKHIDEVAQMSAMTQRRFIYTAYRLGGQQNVKRLLAIALHPQFDVMQRIDTLRLLAIWTNPHEVDQSLGRSSPLKNRNKESIKPLLESQIHTLLELKNTNVVAAAFNLMTKLKLRSDKVSPTVLKGFVEDIRRTGSIRAAALETLKAQDTKLAEQAASTSVSSKNIPLANMALEILAASENPNPQGLIAATQSDELRIRQKAWTLIAPLKVPELDRHLLAAITKLQKSNILGEAIEILDAASKSENKKIKAAFTAYTSTVGADLKKKFNVSLFGGDALIGKNLFSSHPTAACARCHSIGKEGGNAGPNLEGIASVINRKTILESLIDPSARIAPGFGNVSIITKQKKTLTGMFLGEKNGVIKLKVGNDIMKIKRNEVSTLNKLPSSMPPMHLLLKEREIRDIVAFIDSLKQNKKNTGPKSH